MFHFACVCLLLNYGVETEGAPASQAQTSE